MPKLTGRTVLERRREAMERHDDLRRALMWEPRGHSDMYGGWVDEPLEPGSDLSILFLHNEGFSTMCGHGVIALTTVLVETGIVPVEPGEPIRMDTPAGLVIAVPNMAGDRVESVTFRNVPSFAVESGATVDVPEMGPIRYDLGFGGEFYACVDAESSGVRLDDPIDLITSGRAIKETIAASRDFYHPDDSDLAFLYGVIFTGPANDAGSHSRNVCVFADGEVDRSPTGTGVSARLALLHAAGEIGTGDSVSIESISGCSFTGKVAEETTCGDFPAIYPEVTGSAHVLGKAEYWFDPSDGIGKGFVIR